MSVGIQLASLFLEKSQYDRYPDIAGTGGRWHLFARDPRPLTLVAAVRVLCENMVQTQGLPAGY